VTTWPAGTVMAMSWDKDHILDHGDAVGAELRGKGINVAYAPTVEPLGQSAYGGRQGEGYGPDSFLNGYVSVLSMLQTESPSVFIASY
jgi:beta-glucosidase